MVKVLRSRLEPIGFARERSAWTQVNDVSLETGLHRLVANGAQL
jgi:hypothetical protein